MTSVNKTLSIQINYNIAMNHIFFINSPIVLCISLAFIYESPSIQDNVKIITSRRQFIPPMLRRFLIFSFNTRFSDRIFFRFRNIFTYFILAFASKSFTIKPFIFYCSYNIPVLEPFIKHSRCRGIRYIEEGQLSFRSDFNLFDRASPYLPQVDTYSKSSEPLIITIMLILLLPAILNLFPLIFSDFKYVVRLHELDFSWYQPKTHPEDNIVLLPSVARLSTYSWLTLPAYIHQLFTRGYSVKFHPSFCYSPILALRLRSLFLKNSSPSIPVSILPDTSILELEMLNHSLHFHGPQTSVDIYAHIFGSSFNRIHFPGWDLAKRYRF